jgi:HlyD family secretion protein
MSAVAAEPVSGGGQAKLAPAAAKPGTTRRKQPLHRRFRWALWLALFVALVAATPRLLAMRKAPPVAVTTHEVQRGTVRDLVSSLNTGRLMARREVVLRAELSGTVVKLHHRRGDVVKAGEPLLSFDDREPVYRLRIAEAAVTVARAQALQAGRSAEVVRADAERANRLGEVGALSRADADKLVGNADVARASVDVAGAAVMQAAANVNLARYSLEKATVRAPFDGVVLTHSAEQGDVLIPGTPLFGFADVGEMHLDVEYDEADIVRIAPGMSAELTFDALPGERVLATVAAIAPSSQRDLKGSRSVLVELRLAGDSRLRVGLGADADIVVAQHPDVVWIPPGAVVGRGVERSVYVVRDGVAHKRAIEVGISTWEAVEVVKGLAPGDRVVTSLTAKGLDDGARVEAQPEAGEKPAHVGLR